MFPQTPRGSQLLSRPRCHTRVRMIRRVLLVALVLAAALAPAAHAQSRLATYRTPGCTGAPVWSIGYRLYWIDSRGRTASKAGYTTLLDHARRFTEQVGAASRCAVRIRLDVYDQGGRRWPATRDSKRYPDDTFAFQKRHGYDAVFVRFPEMGDEGYGGRARRPSARLAREVPRLGGSAHELGAVEPKATTLSHEWMHLVVGYYKTLGSVAEAGRPRRLAHVAAYPTPARRSARRTSPT